MDNGSGNLLYTAAAAWKELTEYYYVFTYGYKKRLYPIKLTFSPERFPHLAGFQYLKDVELPRFNQAKILDKILDGTIQYTQVEKGGQFESAVKPRLEALIRLKQTIEGKFTLFSFVPQYYSFMTRIQADYLISSVNVPVDFIFIIKADSQCEAVVCDFVCCSAFTKTERDYRENQRPRAVLKKERVHISTNASTILLNRLEERT